jgi:Uma2 family endonuclease
MSTAPEHKKLTADEYFKLTENWTERTELIDGEIVYLDRDASGQVVALAQPSRLHQRIAYRMHGTIDSFIRANHGACEVNGEIDVRLDDENTVVPDIAVVCDPSKLDDHGCNGAPDWVVEITSTNRADDFDRKLRLYRKSGVREYWIVDTDDRKVWVYDFEQHPNVVEMYDWADTIPVHIYGGKLTIRIADMV